MCSIACCCCFLHDKITFKEEVRSLLETHSDRSIATILRNRGYTNKKTADVRKIRLENSKENELDNAIKIIFNQNSNVKKVVIIKLLKNTMVPTSCDYSILNYRYLRFKKYA